MRVKMTVIALSLASIILPASNLDETGGAWNGRAWHKMSQGMKLAYLRGASEGDGLCEVVAGAQRSWPRRLTFGEIAKAIDRLYAEPTNANVPVVFGALAYVRRKAEGVMDEDLKVLAAKLRQQSQ